KEKKQSSNGSMSDSQKVGQVTGKVLDTKNRMRANIQRKKEQVRDLPTTAQYAVVQGKEQIKRPVKDFKKGITQAKERTQYANKERTAAHCQTIAEKRMALD